MIINKIQIFKNKKIMLEISFFEKPLGKRFSYRTRKEESVNKIKKEVLDYLNKNDISFEVNNLKYNRNEYIVFVKDVRFDFLFEFDTCPSEERCFKKDELYKNIDIDFSEDNKIEWVSIDLSETYNLRACDIIKIIEDVQLFNLNNYTLDKLHPQIQNEINYKL